MSSGRFLLAAACLAVSCARGGEPGAGREVPAPAPTVVSPPALPLLSPPPLAAGTRLTLVPNLPDVHAEDLPTVTRRTVEILEVDGRRLKLRWSGRVRLESPESSRRREEWVRARANAPPRATPLPEITAEYEEKEVGGTLEFPDFGRGRAFLLPGIWPEGRATLKESSAVWVPAEARRELISTGRSRLPFFPPSPFLKDPAAELLARAAAFAASRPPADAEPPADVWVRRPSPGRVFLTLDGRDGEVATVRAVNWFGTYEILDDEKNPLVVSVLPDPPSSLFLDLFAPAGVLKTLLGYRVASIETPVRPSVPAPP